MRIGCRKKRMSREQKGYPRNLKKIVAKMQTQWRIWKRIKGPMKLEQKFKKK